MCSENYRPNQARNISRAQKPQNVGEAYPHLAACSEQGCNQARGRIISDYGVDIQAYFQLCHGILEARVVFYLVIFIQGRIGHRIGYLL